MKVLIVNGNPKPENIKFDTYLDDLKTNLEKSGNEVKIMVLRDMILNDCIGCYSCWLKTPGVCCFNDGMTGILKEYFASDLVLSASPIIMGFVSSLLKRVSDRSLPCAHPFLTMREDRMAHVPRYSHYPKTALLLDEAGKLGEGSAEIIEKVYRNSSRSIAEIWYTSISSEEVAYAINNI